MGTKVIWDGESLPPIGCKVLVKLSSEKDMRPYKVVGHETRVPMKTQDVPANQPWLFVVVIKLESQDGKSVNERFLNEVFPLDIGVKYAN